MLGFLKKYHKQMPDKSFDRINLGRSAEFKSGSVKWKSDANELTIMDNSLVHGSILFDDSIAKVIIGKRTFIGGGTKLISAESITIGDDVLISWGVTIVDHNSHAIEFSKRKDDVTNWAEGNKDWTHVKRESVVIGNKCWIGFNVIILKGVKLGEGCVVGAGSVVTKSFPAWSVIAGNPAKLIRVLGEDER
ncbi:acyltransferase [bacterium]|nr:MAG: acyltransferase [bacterium]